MNYQSKEKEVNLLLQNIFIEENIEWHNYIGTIYIEKKDNYSEALRHFKIAYDLNPKSSETL